MKKILFQVLSVFFFVFILASSNTMAERTVRVTPEDCRGQFMAEGWITRGASERNDLGHELMNPIRDGRIYFANVKEFDRLECVPELDGLPTTSLEKRTPIARTHCWHASITTRCGSGFGKVLGIALSAAAIIGSFVPGVNATLVVGALITGTSGIIIGSENTQYEKEIAKIAKTYHRDYKVVNEPKENKHCRHKSGKWYKRKTCKNNTRHAQLTSCEFHYTNRCFVRTRDRMIQKNGKDVLICDSMKGNSAASKTCRGLHDSFMKAKEEAGTADTMDNYPFDVMLLPVRGDQRSVASTATLPSGVLFTGSGHGEFVIDDTNCEDTGAASAKSCTPWEGVKNTNNQYWSDNCDRIERRKCSASVSVSIKATPWCSYCNGDGRRDKLCQNSIVEFDNSAKTQWEYRRIDTNGNVYDIFVSKETKDKTDYIAVPTANNIDTKFTSVKVGKQTSAGLPSNVFCVPKDSYFGTSQYTRKIPVGPNQTLYDITFEANDILKATISNKITKDVRGNIPACKDHNIVISQYEGHENLFKVECDDLRFKKVLDINLIGK